MADLSITERFNINLRRDEICIMSHSEKGRNWLVECFGALSVAGGFIFLEKEFKEDLILVIKDANLEYEEK